MLLCACALVLASVYLVLFPLMVLTYCCENESIREFRYDQRKKEQPRPLNRKIEVNANCSWRQVRR